MKENNHELLKFTINCGFSGTGIMLSIRNIRKSENTFLKVLNICCICLYILNTALVVTRFISIKKTEKNNTQF